MPPLKAGKRGAVKRRRPTEDDQVKPAKEEEDGTKQCGNAIRKNPNKLARHSSTHLIFRPFRCSVCAYTGKCPRNAKMHLKHLHQGTGRVIDNRTARYFDALEALTKANFPDHSEAIAIYFGGQKKTLRIQDGSDEEDDNPPIVHLPASDHESLDIRENVQTMPEVVSGTSVIKQEVMSNDLPPPSIEKRADRTLPDIRREIMQEPLEKNMRNGEGERIEDPFDQHLAVDVETDPMLDFAELDAGIEKAKLDVSRMGAKVTFLETLSETRDAENHRLKHEIQARDAENDRLKQEIKTSDTDSRAENDRLKQDIEARDAENSRLESEKDQMALLIRLLQHEIAGLKRELGLG
ncbi:unnamed protein product, partial [Mesorhabditis spiculigera]